MRINDVFMRHLCVFISPFLCLQVQFVMIMCHQFQLLFTECDYPRSFMIWIGLHGVLFLGLFSDFYKTKYKDPTNKNSTKVHHISSGGCMPVLDENEKSMHNCASSYATMYNKEYNSCYSNGTNNGYVANNNTEKKLVQDTLRLKIDYFLRSAVQLVFYCSYHPFTRKSRFDKTIN